MSPFRLFSRPPEPRYEPATGSGEGTSWAPGPWDPGAPGGDPRPATRHARPVAFGLGSEPAHGRAAMIRADDDPLTDPYGFAPIGAAEAPVDPVPPPVPDPLEAAALAGAFAADYLSWDEDDPARRGGALADHLAAPVGDPARLGWDGRGRQRAEVVLPGLVRADGDDRVLVDVRVRVTPFRQVDGVRDGADGDGSSADRPDDRPADVLGVPAAAPAPAGRGWRGCASYWVRLSVPVMREDGRLVVDAAEEAADPPDARPAEPPALPPDPPIDPLDDPLGETTGYARVHALRPVGTARPRLPAHAAPPPVPDPQPESAW